MIHGLAFITAHPGRRDELVAAWRANAPAVRAEDGCIEYTATIDQPDAGSFQAPVGPDTIVIVEKWVSIEALRAHVVAPHMKAYAEKVRDIVASRVIRTLTPL
jgi:quinol monooxygenase YgiN